LPRVAGLFRAAENEAFMNTSNNRNMRAPEAVEYIGLSASTLAKMRLRGDGPPTARRGVE
jgi:predicted DNA-binding transcriptional regulator AlpA